METCFIKNQSDWETWVADRQAYAGDFEAAEMSPKLPLLVVYTDSEANGWPYVEYQLFTEDRLEQWLGMCKAVRAVTRKPGEVNPQTGLPYD